MSVSGLCEICTTGDVEHDCERCGRLVCADCWDRDTGLCVECAADTRRPTERVEDVEDGWTDGTEVNRL